MKRSLSLVLILGLACQIIFANGGAEAQGGSVKPLRVAVQSMYCSSVVGYLMDNGLDKQAGIPFEVSVFSGGAPINEAMAANLWDVAVTGGAFIFALAQYNGKLIGHQIDGAGRDVGNVIYTRKGNPIMSVKGWNRNFPDVYGSPDTLRGQVILHNTGTTSQYLAMNYLEIFGLKDSDVQLVSLDFPLLYSSFASGQADLTAATAPYTFKAEEHVARGEWEKVASLPGVKAPLLETMVATESAYNNRREDLIKFVRLVYQANDAMSNEQAWFNCVKKWYADNGKNIPDADVWGEVRSKPLISSAQARTINLKDFAMRYCDFFIGNGMIEANRRSIVESNICQDILDAALR